MLFNLIVFIFAILLVLGPVSLIAQNTSEATTPSSEKIRKENKKRIKDKIRKKAQKKKKVQHVKRKSAVKVKKKALKKKKKAQRSLTVWLKKLKKRIARTHAKRNQIVSVGAVRGNKKPDSPPLYWKGKKSKGPVDLPEIEEFNDALELAINGEKILAIEKLEQFIANNPKSSLRDDATHTVVMLRKAESPTK
ncbi:hypothetical protein BVX98_06520 [bacterium F11]|nr:hypothetical protein BVX98_06520 [bacterium F11]